MNAEATDRTGRPGVLSYISAIVHIAAQVALTAAMYIPIFRLGAVV